MCSRYSALLSSLSLFSYWHCCHSTQTPGRKDLLDHQAELASSALRGHLATVDHKGPQVQASVPLGLQDRRDRRATLVFRAHKVHQAIPDQRVQRVHPVHKAQQGHMGHRARQERMVCKGPQAIQRHVIAPEMNSVKKNGKSLLTFLV